MTRAAVATALAFLLASAACGTAGSTPRQAVVLRPEIPADRIAALRADPRIRTWEDGEEVLAVCEPEKDRTLVITTHRHMRLRPGWQTPEMQGTITGAETIHREESRRLPPRLVLRTQTAIARSGSNINYGACDVNQVEAVVRQVIQLRADAGDADALQERHARLGRQHQQRADEAARRERARMASVDLHSPPIEGITWEDFPARVQSRRAQFDAFDVEPRDLAWAARQSGSGENLWDCNDATGPGRQCSMGMPITYSGACRAAAVGALPGYIRQNGESGTMRVECRNHAINMSLGGMQSGVVSMQQFRNSDRSLIYEKRVSMDLFRTL